MHSHSHAIDPRVARLMQMAGESRGRGRHRRHGPGPWGFRGLGGPRGPRARRGDVRAALLVLLYEQPRNGYQLMQEIEQRSDGAWRPSPGSVYPALQQLEDEGLVRATETEGRKAYELTYEGQQHVEERREQLGRPWDAVREDAQGGPWNIGHLIRQVAIASTQVVQTGTDAQVAEAESILKEARRSLYRVLAEDEPTDDEPAPEDA